MHPLVRDAYKRLLWAGRGYPRGGLAAVRERAKAGFREHAALTDTTALMHAVHAARWWEKELAGVAALHKYRAMRQRYGGAPSVDAEADRLEAAYRSGGGRSGGGGGAASA